MSEGFGWCDLHGKPVYGDTYEWKGCWGCHHFAEEEGFPYVSVQIAASELGVSCSTVRRWIKSGKLKGRIFEQGRNTGLLPSPRKYHIVYESVRKAKAC
jgi:hypothetical protein